MATPISHHATPQAACAAALPPAKADPPAWDIAQEAAVRVAIAKHFNAPAHPLPPDREPSGAFAVVNPSEEFMLEAKSPRAMAALRPFLSTRDIPPPHYLTNPQALVGASCHLLDYLLAATSILKASAPKQRFSGPSALLAAICTGQDHPATIESIDWRILIAPRIHNDG